MKPMVLGRTKGKLTKPSLLILFLQHSLTEGDADREDEVGSLLRFANTNFFFSAALASHHRKVNAI